MPVSPAALNRLIARLHVAVTVSVIGLALAAWILPVEIAQSWAVQRAGDDEFEKFEAFGAATALVWLMRFGFTGACLVSAAAWPFRRRLTPVIASSITGAIAAVTIPAAPRRSRVVQLLVLGWLGLAAYHSCASIQRRLWDWPVYRLQDGQTVLPNISPANREVIRYLQAATPPGSRILVLSDQKLFFLSYYLLPRRLYHPTHPDSAYVIPKPYNQRQLPAYRLTDIDAERIQRLRPDYVVEYFEGATYLDGRDLATDPGWIEFQRRRRGPEWKPTYLMSLKPWPTGDHP